MKRSVSVRGALIKSPRCNAERFGGFDIDGHVKFARLHNWQIPAATPLRCFNRVR
jgi:hypothetical protein